MMTLFCYSLTRNDLNVYATLARMEAYLGAMSRWLTLNPEMAKPEQPTAKTRAMMAVI